jgi:hypothetical protein
MSETDGCLDNGVRLREREGVGEDSLRLFTGDEEDGEGEDESGGGGLERFIPRGETSAGAVASRAKARARIHSSSRRRRIISSYSSIPKSRTIHPAAIARAVASV